MKRILMGIMLAGFCLLIRAKEANAVETLGFRDSNRVLASEDPCMPEDDVLLPVKSITLFVRKTAPENVIVVGQDETKRGVDIEVTIKAESGSATYYKWVTHEDDAEWILTDDISSGMECTRVRGNQSLCYPAGCEAQPTETIYRMIWPERTRVWLDADPYTRQWLSWGENPTGDPLRFVFPDDWGLGAWTPEGWKMRGNAGPGSEWWTFLYGDPLSINVPTTNLEKISEPSQDLFSPAKQILGLWGTFNDYPTGMEQCLIGKTNTEGVPLGGVCNIEPGDARSIGNLTSTVSTFTIKFLNVPLDLPGHWMIGVAGYQYPAWYANGTRSEKRLREIKGEAFDEFSPELRIGPSHLGFTPNFYDITEAQYSFDSYIIISTPCLAADPESCVN
jgi:hypothetical protein